MLGTRLTFSGRPRSPPFAAAGGPPPLDPPRLPPTALGLLARAPHRVGTADAGASSASRSRPAAGGALRHLCPRCPQRPDEGVTRTPSAIPHAERAQPERPPACGGEAARQLPRIQAKLSGRRALIPGLREPPAWDVQKIRSVSRFNLVHLIHAAV